jgi:hypothetical protein
MRTNMNCRRLPGRLALLTLLILLVSSGRPLVAQKQPPPVLPNPAAPVLTGLSSTGMQRGGTVELTLTGTNLANATGVYTSFPAWVTIPRDNKNGLDDKQLRIRLQVPGDAPVGYHTLRVTTLRGISNLRVFCIDDLPQVGEVNSNRDKATPQVLPVPCVVSSKLDAEKSTWFRISVKAGERLSFDVLGRRLGGPIDPQLTIYPVGSNRDIAYENDSPGCQTDPRLSYVFKTAGDYLIEVKDVLNRGGPDYTFRLRVGDFPLATVPIPMAVQRGKKTTVTFAGPEVTSAAPITVQAPTDFAVQSLSVVPKGPSGLYGWPVVLAISDFPQSVDRDPSNDPTKAPRLEIPGGITARFLKSDQTNACIFEAKKGQKLLVEVQTLELGSPTLVYMVVRNAKTKAEIAKSNPQAIPPLDQIIDFTAPEDGDYLVEVQHLNYLGGPSEAYHLTIAPSRPSFEVTVGLDRFDLAADGFAALPLQIKRTNYNGPVDVSVLGPASLTGKGTIPANQQAGILLVKAAKDMPLGPSLITLIAKADIDKIPVKQLVSVRGAVSQSLANLPLPPRNLLTQIAIGVRASDPFRLTASLDSKGIVAGLPASFTVAVDRRTGFDSDVVLNPPAGLPPGVTAPKMPTIAKGQKEIKLKLDIGPKVPAGPYTLLFSGKGKRDGKEYTVAALPVLLEVVTQPFDLEVTPAKVTLAAGTKTKITVKVTRKGGYDGPINVEVKNLPAKVTATKGTIAKDQSTIDLELDAAADAALGSKMDVQISGVATALAGAAGNSPNFTVTIEKQ